MTINFLRAQSVDVQVLNKKNGSDASDINASRFGADMILVGALDGINDYYDYGIENTSIISIFGVVFIE